ncbi:hypothetical protein H8E88_23115 [candidate division KSB1 bacterium]|nr:hypothetical protein [candidate division KSB1 bacterium]
MNLWEKIKQGMQDGVDKTAELVEEGIGKVIDQRTDALGLSQLQSQVEELREKIKDMFAALGGEVYVFYTTDRRELIVDHVMTNIEELETLRQELEKKEIELEKKSKIYEDQSISNRKFMQFKDELEESEGTLEHLFVDETTSYIGKKLSEIDCPEEVLMTLVSREGAAIIPSGSTEISIGDKIVLLGKKEAVIEMLSKFKPQTEQ